MNSTDFFSAEKRSQIMSRIRGYDTKPELTVRSIIHRMGYRFRLHGEDLPGNPDVVLPKHRKVVFVHGCFWHGHKGCPRSKRPGTNVSFWQKKLDENIARDQRQQRELKRLGWKYLVIWQCEINKEKLVLNKIKGFLTRKSRKEL